MSWREKNGLWGQVGLSPGLATPWFWRSYLSSLSLTLFIYEMKITVSASYFFCFFEDEIWLSTHVKPLKIQRSPGRCNGLLAGLQPPFSPVPVSPPHGTQSDSADTYPVVSLPCLLISCRKRTSGALGSETCPIGSPAPRSRALAGLPVLTQLQPLGSLLVSTAPSTLPLALPSA